MSSVSVAHQKIDTLARMKNELAVVGITDNMIEHSNPNPNHFLPAFQGNISSLTN